MSDMRLDSVESFLRKLGVQPHRLKDSQIVRIQKEWRRHYSHAVMEKTGRWVHEGIDWHVFSYGFKKAVVGSQVSLNYEKLKDKTYYFFGGKPQFGFSCDGPLPELKGLRSFLEENRWAYDVYLAAADYSWTTVLTHENSDPRIACFYSRAEWQDKK